MTSSLGEFHSREELSAMIRAIEDDQLIRLGLAGRSLAAKCGIRPHELLNEAILRSLTGDRNCPKRMRVIPYLFSTMRSISDEWGEQWKATRHVESIPEEGLADNVQPFGVEPIPDPEEALITRQRIGFGARVYQAVLKMFADDEEAMFIINFDIDGEGGPDEVCDSLGIDRKRYNTIRKRIRRGYDRIREGFTGKAP